MGFEPTTSRLKVGGSTAELTALEKRVLCGAAAIVAPVIQVRAQEAVRFRPKRPILRPGRTLYLLRSLMAACNSVSVAAVTCAGVILLSVTGSSGTAVIGRITFSSGVIPTPKILWPCGVVQ